MQSEEHYLATSIMLCMPHLRPNMPYFYTESIGAHDEVLESPHMPKS